jgi:hypothetical protein
MSNTANPSVSASEQFNLLISQHVIDENVGTEPMRDCYILHPVVNRVELHDRQYLAGSVNMCVEEEGKDGGTHVVSDPQPAHVKRDVPVVCHATAWVVCDNCVQPRF